MRRWILVLLPILLFFALPAQAEEEAENLNRQGTWTFAGGKISPRGDYINDNNSESRRTLALGKTLRIRFPEEVCPASLGIEWYNKPIDARLEFYNAAGTLLGQETENDVYISVITLPEDTHEIVIRPLTAALGIAKVDVFGAGSLPEPYHIFEPLPEKLDYLVIVAHPDDDTLFLGGAIPYLSGEEGLIGTVVYMTKPALHQRNTEALNGAWTMGIRYMPIFWSMKDVYANSMEKLYEFVNREETLRYLVELIRRYRPTVLFTHEPEGEYGHLEHRLICALTLEAVEKAQDISYDGGSAELYGTWQVQKLYWHDYEQAETHLLFDPDTPLASFNGKTAYEICREAYKKHKSQQSRSFAVHRYGEHANSFNFFGLAYSAVGEQAEVRAGIDPSLFSDYVPSMPTAAPEASATPMPTATPGNTPGTTQATVFQPEATAKADLKEEIPETKTSGTFTAPAAVNIAGNDTEETEKINLPAEAYFAIAALLLMGFFGARLWLKKWRQCS